jgi:hypothetical protein
MPDAAGYDAPMLGFFLKKLLTGDAPPGQETGVGMAVADTDTCRSLYLDLMQACLQGRIYDDPPMAPPGKRIFDPVAREKGRDWPSRAHTMIGNQRLGNLRFLTEQVLKDGVPGDLIETGVWRGGACIFMRAILKAYGATDRKVWVADSFQGLPPPDEEHYPADKGSDFHLFDEELGVSVEQVKANFEKYKLLDSQVEFLEGWFKDTLPTAPIERLAILRLDGDMYESTIVALDALYHKLSPGGFAIIDDYGAVDACRKAVTDFRSREGIEDPIYNIDGWGACWRKTA